MSQKEQLIEAIGLTPFAREEFYRALAGKGEALSDLERARRFVVWVRQVRTGLAQTASLGRQRGRPREARRGRPASARRLS